MTDAINGDFKGKSILSVDRFGKEDLGILFSEADKMKKLVEQKGGNALLRNKVMTALFYEPSSRTFGSFITAMQRLGGGIIPIQGVESTSVRKGESLADTIRVFGCYSDIIVLRHPEKGSAEQAAKISYVPILNAGDGSREHPTQGLLDMYTIRNHFNPDKKLVVAMVGDLKYGRTIHSLARLMANFPAVRQIFVSPEALGVPAYIKSFLRERGIEFAETDSLDQAVKQADVLYLTRVQKERFTSSELYDKVKNVYRLDKNKMKLAKEKMIVMHPLPRITEIAEEIDRDSRSVYLSEQMRNGLYIRMALLKLILS